MPRTRRTILRLFSVVVGIVVFAVGYAYHPACAGSQAQSLVFQPQQGQHEFRPSLKTPPSKDELTIPSRPKQSNRALLIIRDQALSGEVTRYLHRHRLPFVTVEVLKNSAGDPVKIVLYGRVRSQFGKQDAVTKSRVFLAQSGIEVQNEIRVVQNLSSDQNPAGVERGTITVIPSAFLGCWRGTDMGFDSSEHLGGCPPSGDVPTTVELCLRKTGTGGVEITYQSQTSPVPHYRARSWLTGSDGDTRIDFRSSGSYGYAPQIITFKSSSHCGLMNDVLACHDSSTFVCNNVPWYRVTSHFKLRRVR